LGNYTVALSNGVLAVTPAPLTVTASNATRLFGASNPVFTGSIVGLENGDNITAAYSCSAATNSPAGSYPIVPALLDPADRLGNYSVTTNDGTLTVSGTNVPTYAVTTSVSPAAAGVASGGGLYTNGAPVVLAATLNSGYQFVAWTEAGQVVSSSQNYAFSVGGNRSLVANFAVYPFVAPKGSYCGLFADETNGVSPQSCGYFTLATAAKSGFSASLQVAGAKYSLSGTFDGTGKASQRIMRGTLAPLTVNLRLELLSGAEWISGTVSDGAWTAALYGGRAAFDARTNVAPQWGNYTLIIPGIDGSATEPGGDSYGTVAVSKGGTVSFQGNLADGTSLSPSAPLLNGGQWPLYASLHSGQGVLWGWLYFTNASALGGSVSWVKPALGSGNYPHGFAVTSTVLRARHSPPCDGTNVLGLTRQTDLTLTLTGNALAESITNRLALAANATVSTLSGPRASLSFKTSTGVFQGSVANPGGSGSISFAGVLLQDQRVGSGFFIGHNEAGEVRLEW
jgi:hypothetical protein